MPVSHRSTVSSSASTAAFGAARAVTSYARKVYVCNYLGKCKRPVLSFAIDGTLLALAAMLVGIAAWFTLQPEPVPLVHLSLTTAPFAAGAPTPLQIVLRPEGPDTLKNVRLRWLFPQGTQLLQSNPTLARDGSVFLGDLLPGAELVSHVVARPFQDVGEQSTFTVEVSYDNPDGSRAAFYASAERPVATSALLAELPEAFAATGFVSADGTTIPIRVTNQTSATLPSVHLSVLASGAAGEQLRQLGDLLPHESRTVYVTAFPVNGEATVSWSAGAASRDLVSDYWRGLVSAQPGAAFPEITSPLIARPGEPVTFTVSSAADGGVLAFHPALPIAHIAFFSDGRMEVLSDPASVSVTALDSEGSYEVTLPALPEDRPTNHEWLVVPLRRDSYGDLTVLGPASLGVSAGSLPFTAQVRYVSTAGDQLGAGPHPPRAGLETRYWAFWTVGPVESELKDIVVEADLPEGVEATGNVSAPDGGAVEIRGRHVTFMLPRLGGESGISETTAGFEIRVTPRASQIGTPILLLGQSVARASDTHETSFIFEARDGTKDSRLPEDKGDERKAIVAPAE
jgi:hypothetical protein